MNDIIQRLRAGRAMAWRDLKPVFDHAIAMARECDFVAAQASNMVQAAIQPAYPPLVQMLAESVDARGLFAEELEVACGYCTHDRGLHYGLGGWGDGVSSHCVVEGCHCGRFDERNRTDGRSRTDG